MFRLLDQNEFSRSTLVMHCASIAAVALGVVMAAIRSAPVVANLAGRPGGMFNVVVACLSVPLLGAFCILLFRERICLAFGIFLIALNVTGRAEEVFGITAYTFEGGFEQRISITTALLIVMALFSLRMRTTPLTRHSPARTFLIFFLMFGGFTTLSQYLNHPFASASLLSLGAVWQYVGLFIVIRASVNNLNDVRFILKCIIAALIISSLIRLGVRGESFLSFSGSDNQRLGSVTFGPFVYYAGTVAMVIIATVWQLRSSHGTLAKFMWSMVVLYLCGELVITVTNGGYVAVTTIVLGILWKKERRFVLDILGIACAILAITWNTVGAVVTSRGLGDATNLLNHEDVATRLWLDLQGLNHFFDRAGFGYGIGKGLSFSNSLYYAGRALPMHNMILETSQMAGGFAAIMITVCFIFAGVKMWQTSRSKSSFATCSVYLLLAVTSWFVFANTTAVSLLCYEPYEATILMYTILFTGVRVAELDAVRKASECRYKGNGPYCWAAPSNLTFCPEAVRR